MCRKRHGLAVCMKHSGEQSACRNLIRRHCRLHNDIARILLAGDGQAEELPRSLPEAAAPEAKRSCFATTLYK